jgi:4-amino-4-deoxy-L-arabinose transferase-like glycosyltransferase
MTVTSEATTVGAVRRRWALHWCVLPVLVVAAVANGWGLTAGDWGNSYYSAAVRSMGTNWHSFFFASFDSGGFVTVDKAPFSLWLAVLSTKVFGYREFAVLLPSVVAGTLSVLFVYLALWRVWGRVAGLAGALTLTVTPIAAAVSHSNNTDAVLVCVMSACALVGVEAARRGQLSWLIGACALGGLGVTTKMLAALPMVPGLFLAFMWCAPLSWRRRVVGGLVGAGVVAVSALWWFAIVELTPPDARPYVGSTQTNSTYELVFERNGVNQVEGTQVIGPTPGGGANPGAPVGGAPQLPPGFPPLGGGNGGAGGLPQLPPGFPGPGGTSAGPGGLRGNVLGLGFAGGDPGPMRLLNSDLGTQIGWLMPLVLLGAVSGLLLSRFTPSSRLGALVIFGGWAASAGTVFSITEGIVHPYYVSQLAPPFAALVGIGVAGFRLHLAQHTARQIGVWLLPVGLALTAANQWVLWGRADWNDWVVHVVAGQLVGAALTLVWMVITSIRSGNATDQASPLRRQLAVACLAVAAPLVAPAVWLQGSLSAGISGPLPYASPEAGVAGRGPGRGLSIATDAERDALVTFLRGEQTTETWLLGVGSAETAEPIIIDTGEAVMAMGGFIGTDPILTIESLRSMIDAGDIRFFQVSAGGRIGFGPQRGRAGAVSNEVTQWIADSCAVVPEVKWKPAPGSQADPNSGANDGAPTDAASQRRRRIAERLAPSFSLYDCASLRS